METKKTITESQLRAIVKEAVKSVLKEEVRPLNPNLPTMAEVIEKIDKISDELTKVVQLDLANAILNEYEKGSVEYNEAMNARKKLLELDVKGQLWDFRYHSGESYERIGY